jgi:uncharacterized protein involved in exopolysaccharide biosynthesis
MDSTTTSSRYPHDGDDYDYDGEIDLMPYLEMVWRHRLAITAVTLLFGVVAFVLSWRTPPTFEARAQVIVTTPKVGSEPGAAANVTTFRGFLDNQSLAAQVIQDTGLKNPPYLLTPSSFLAEHTTVRIVPDTSIIAISVRLSEPTRAAAAANRFAKAAVELAQRLSQEETVTARDMIKTQLDQSRTRLEQAVAQLENFRKKAQIDLLRKDVDALLGQRGGLVALLVDIQAEKARLAEAEALFAKRERIETLKRSIDTDPAAMEAARRSGSANVLPLELRNEYFNPVYESLDQVIATSRTKLAGQEKQKTELIDVRRLDANQQAKLSLLYEQETQLSQLQTEYDLSRTVYLDVATRYEQARLQVAGRSPQLQILDQALVPERPIAPRPRRTAALGAATGFGLSVLAALLIGVLRRSRGPERPPKAAGE